ncbi:alpha/beta fold hydrolase [Leptospira bandrabouensis]|uniref:alpha/beta fold hydrolase n=1 Tax=Leptospira bandrabouensis TaxID=2484903 RepID=UPI001EEC5544|nr:alpha/beta hydrolase [Leptospira bandrabouensis]MCG6151687.1 alpha/beta hydrolase [Leptospira bandrabouensis]
MLGTWKRNLKEFDLDINGSSVRVATDDNPIQNRPYIVFLHDSLGCISLWKDLPIQLGEMTNCNLLVYDRIGYGKSDPFASKTRNNSYLEDEADYLIKILQKLNIKKVILFGHSDGGSIALITASRYPSYILGVISEGAHVFVEEITIEGILKAKEIFKTTKLKQILEKYHGYKTEDIFNAWVDTWLSQNFRNWNIEYLLPSIKCPVLVLQGEFDEYGTEKQVDAIANAVSGKSIKKMIPNAKHTPHKEKPEIIMEDISNFINSFLP